MQRLATGLQVSDSNPIQGLEGRASLLIKLGEALKNTHLFGAEGRPGHMIGELQRERLSKICLKWLQITSSLIRQHKPPRYPSSQYLRFGPF